MLENYHVDEFGILHQTRWSSKTYDQQYLSYYEGLRERTVKLGYQRFGWVMGLLGRLPSSVFEVGYGMGTFLEAAQIGRVPDCSGYDVARYPLPAGCNFVELSDALKREWDLTAMFDVLEHIPDLSFLGKLSTKFIALAVPYCRWQEFGDDWFAAWRMRLPDEHLHHFSPDSLTALMNSHGFRAVQLNAFEDGLRLRDGEAGPNILSGFFQREL